MTITTRKRASLGPLDAAQLRAVTGGIVGPEYSSTVTIGNPEDFTGFAGGVRDYLPAAQR